MRPGKRIITSNDDNGQSYISKTDDGIKFDMPHVDDWFSVEYWSMQSIPADPKRDDGLSPNGVKLIPDQTGCIFRDRKSVV